MMSSSNILLILGFLLISLFISSCSFTANSKKNIDKSKSLEIIIGPQGSPGDDVP